MRPIDMIVWFDIEGKPHPIKFRTTDNQGEYIAISLDRVSYTEIEEHAGNRIIRFDCLATIRDIQRKLQIKYEMTSCKWYLAKL